MFLLIPQRGMHILSDLITHESESESESRVPILP